MGAVAKRGPKPKPASEIRSVSVPLKATPTSVKLWRRAQAKAKARSFNAWAIAVLDEAAKNLLNPPK